MDLQQIKQRFGIIGASKSLDRALEIAVQVASTDLSVLITGESGVGKEIFPKIIHQFSSRKHGKYIAVNCGAIPEGTIDSELFGHEKGAFTGAHDKRRGYFEVADKGTIFLDEVAELPLSTQVRLLRVLETGEFMKVGSSDAQKTDVRIVTATNISLNNAILEGKFREDLFYRLNTVPIFIPPLRNRPEDIYLLFRKFAQDFAEKYRMPIIKLDDDARETLINYRWPGNVRQLKNVTEQISIIEENRQISNNTILQYLPDPGRSNLPAVFKKGVDETTFNTEREILYKILFDMKNDMTELKKLVYDILQNDGSKISIDNKKLIINKLNRDMESHEPVISKHDHSRTSGYNYNENDKSPVEDTEEYIEESLLLEEKEKELIIKALERHNGKRKNAAKELGISERTLYRKIKEFDIN